MKLVNDNVKINMLFTNILFGSILLYSYYYYYKHNKKTFPKLWGNIRDNNKYLLSFSVFLAAISYVYIFIYLLNITNNKRNNILLKELNIQQILLIIISILWTPLSIMYLKNDDNKVLLRLAIMLVLFIVSMCCLLYYKTLSKLSLNKNIYRKMVLVCAIILFAHTFIGDFLIWSYNFF